MSHTSPQKVLPTHVPVHIQFIRECLSFLGQVWDNPWLSALQALLIYGFFASLRTQVWSVSPAGYFNYLADAFIHGQLFLRFTPPTTHDLSFYQGRYYLYWPPMPAIMLLPFVAVFGLQFSDTLFTIAIGALNVALVGMVLQSLCAKEIIYLSRAQRGLLVLCFAIGTVHITLAPYGRVWNTGQVVGFMWVALCYLAVVRMNGIRAFVAAGIAIAAALLTRNHLVFAGLWPMCYLLYQHRSFGWKRLSIYSLVAFIPIIITIAYIGWYNWARFGSLTDNGLNYHQMAEMFVGDYKVYGPFSFHYVPINVFYQYIAYPFPLRNTSLFGGSLFLLTPVFLGAFGGIIGMRPRWSMWALLASLVLVALPILLLMGTGWAQFGPRYTLDFTVPLLIFTAIGISRWRIEVIGLLVAISIVHYLVGAFIVPV